MVILLGSLMVRFSVEQFLGQLIQRAPPMKDQIVAVVSSFIPRSSAGALRNRIALPPC
jgi:hypothetical protein